MKNTWSAFSVAILITIVAARVCCRAPPRNGARNWRSVAFTVPLTLTHNHREAHSNRGRLFSALRPGTPSRRRTLGVQGGRGMKLSDMGRLVALMTTVTFMFTGCGGWSRQQAAPDGEHAAHKMAGSSGALIYATGGCGGICVGSYPAGLWIALALVESLVATAPTAPVTSSSLIIPRS